MYASSRLARRGDSSCSSSPFLKATSPTCSAVVPLTSSVPASGEVTVAPSAARAAASSPACGERTRTAPPARVDDLLDRAGGDDATAADHQEMVGGLGHLAHQVRGKEDGSSFGGQGTHELADPLHALGVEPVDRLVEDERPGVA